MAGNEKLKSSYKKILNQYLDVWTRLKNANKNETDEIELFNLNNEEQSLLGKSKFFMKKLTKLIPEEQWDDAQAKLEQVYKTIFKDEKAYQFKKKLVENDNIQYPTKYDKDHYLVVEMPNAVYERGLAEPMFDIIAGYFDGVDLDYLADEIDNYKTPLLDNMPVYPLEDSVEKFKKKNETAIADADKRAELNAELDAVARLVVTSTQEYSDANGDAVETLICKTINARVNNINDAQLAGEFKDLSHYFVERTIGSGVYEIKKELETDVNINSNFRNEKTAFALPEDKKAAVRNILSFMKECGMFDYDNQMGEQGKKKLQFLPNRSCRRKASWANQ